MLSGNELKLELEHDRFALEEEAFMRRSLGGILFVFAICFLTPQATVAQTNTNSVSVRSSQQPTLKDLIDEIRLLRIAVQRINSTAYRAQMTADRLKVQQDHVARLARELNEVRDRIGETKRKQLQMKVMLEQAEQQYQAGIKGDADVKTISGEMDEMKQLEQRLADRESQISGELDAARAEFVDLKRRLDLLEAEILSPPK
jgi:phage shock protein A